MLLVEQNVVQIARRRGRAYVLENGALRAVRAPPPRCATIRT